eukprot:g10660.t1
MQRKADEEAAELDTWMNDLGDDANAAALKMQAKQRQKMAKKQTSIDAEDFFQVEQRRRELEEAKLRAQEESDEAKELDRWMKELGDDANEAALKMQAKQRQKMAKKKVEARRREVEQEQEAAQEESDLDKWLNDLGDDANSAALKMQAKQRQKIAKKRVEAKRRELEEAKQAEEEQAAETAELDQWLDELGDDASSAALKMQAKQRQKMAKKQVMVKQISCVEAKRREIEESRLKEQTAATDETAELDKWLGELGDDANSAAMKMQAKQRQKIAKKQVEARRAELEEMQRQAKEETAELDQWMKELGDDANVAALKMQAKQRQKMAKKEVEAKKTELAAAKEAAQKAAEAEELAAWANDLGDEAIKQRRISVSVRCSCRKIT